MPEEKVATPGLKFIWRGTTPYRRRAAGVLALVIVDTALTSLGVGIVLPVFQALLDPSHANPLLERAFPFLVGLPATTRLIVIAGVTAGVFLLKAVVTFITTWATHDLLLRLRFYWVARMGESYLYGSYQRLAGRMHGELLNDWFNETLAASRFYQSYVAYLASTALVVALAVLGLLVEWRSMLVLLAVGGLFVLLVRRRVYGSAAYLSRLKMQTNQAVTAAMAENLTNIRDIKLLLAEEARLGQLRGLSDSLKYLLLRGAVTGEGPKIAGEFLAVFGLMAFIVVNVAFLSTPPEAILPILAFFFVAFYRLIVAASLMMSSRVKMLNEAHSLTEVLRMTGAPVEREDREHGMPITRVESDIRFSGLGYTYDSGVAALAGIDATIPRGRLTLLLGPSGSGKSTLLDVLLRLTNPTEGAVLVNGQDTRSFNLAQWRGCFGYVSQEAALFYGSILMNLRLARPEASKAEIEAACRLAGAHEFIEALPQGYETIVGDRGYTLSGGQRKRIAIARALMRNPSVLVLDEATTGFEHSLEQDMLRDLKAAMPDLTLIQVTHRLQHAEKADWIIALDKANLVAAGEWSRVKPALTDLFAREPAP
jgi:ABC-type multidrug transport system fused ATPase/permease subunit